MLGGCWVFPARRCWSANRSAQGRGQLSLRKAQIYSRRSRASRSSAYFVAPEWVFPKKGRPLAPAIILLCGRVLQVGSIGLRSDLGLSGVTQGNVNNWHFVA